MTSRSHCLFAAALAAAGCAGSAKSPATARAAHLEPLAGDVAASDAPTLRAFCEQHLASSRQSLDQLRALGRGKSRADIERALELYDEGSSALNNSGSLAETVFNSHPDPAMRAAAEHCQQAAAAALTQLSLDRRIYDVLSALDLSKEDAATRFWITSDLADFKRAGVDRDEATRKQIAALNDEIVTIGQKFDSNINDDTRKLEVDPAELAGLPADWIAQHPAGPNGKVTLTTQYPDYIPFQTFAKSASARERLYRLFHARAYPQNRDVLAQLLAKRYQLARLLGYPNWADFSMANQMIGNAKAAHEFIEQITRASAGRAERDYQTLLARLRQDEPGAAAVKSWDVSYLEQRIGAEQLDFDAQVVRPYFEFRRVQQGLLDVTARLFGIRYQRISDARVWHPDVEVYDVFDGQRRLGRIYLDLHPREGKFSHAAQFSFVDGKEGVRLPEGTLLCNFPKPVGDQPALMDHEEVRTFFHEFGHLLHHVFSGHTRWGAMSQLREHDFVEAPSQLLEEWTENPTVLATFARHIKTDEPIPAALVKRMKAAEEFGRGLDVRQQMLYASVSLDYYDRDPAGLDTTRMWAELQPKLTPYPFVDGTFPEMSFGHLSGYAASYYTYMWSLVIAKDLFTPFEAAGLLDSATALRYRRAVLEAGGTKPAADMVREFLGRTFSFDAYSRWLDERS